MKKTLNLFVVAFIIFLSACTPKTEEKYQSLTATDKNGETYEYVTDDPFGVRIYTLENGLKVYMSVNKDEPRIQTFIAVRAGSTYDPSETTGLAHYLEHMMFKGSTKFGTTNWVEEKKLIDQIADKYEEHKNTSDPEQKRSIYAQIDSLSTVASKLAIANEYDKLLATIGGSNTNAWTSNEETVYVNEIPSNEIERWLTIERERFDTLVLRLFHTELETVYEEFNMSQDNDSRKLYYQFYASLFPNHPYGTQTTIGKAEHLKNPSMKNIHKYFNTYYVPNNMAICLAGDFDFDETYQLIKKHWGTKERKEVAPITHNEASAITEPVEVSVYGPEAERLMLGYRFGGETNSDDIKYVTLINSLLYNGKAGLIDLNLNQKQKVLQAYSYSSFMKEYGVHSLFAKPREGQTLEEARDLLLEQIEKIKAGDFEDWMLEAAINNFRLNEIKKQESNNKAYSFVDAFIIGKDWKDEVKFIDDLEKINKQQLVDFANKNYTNNYVVTYKRIGADSSVVKVEKPKITPLEINRDVASDFFTGLVNQKPNKIEPVFVDYKKELTFDKVNDLEFTYLTNKANEIFTLQYIVEMGKDHNLKLPLAVNYLEYLGTDKYTAEELQKELYKLGLSIGVYSSDDRSYVYISGLDKSYEKGIELIEHVLANVKPDQKAYDDYIDGILKERQNNKLNKSQILYGGLMSYGIYGEKSPFRNILSEEELKAINPEELTNILKEFLSYKHSFFYYGQKPIEEAKNILAKYHKPTDLKEIPAKTEYAELETNSNKVYWVNYDMVQTNLLLLSKGQKLNNSLESDITLFNEYFGGGMSSIVFQEIREAKALAYSAYAVFTSPSRPEKSHYLYAFVATQVDKLKIATDAMLELLNNIPKVQKNFDESRENIMTRIETERITKKNIFWNYKGLLDKGLKTDTRKEVYEAMKTATMDDFNKFYENNVKDKNYTFLVIGKKENLNLDVLKQLGEVQELSLEQLFNY